MGDTTFSNEADVKLLDLNLSSAANENLLINTGSLYNVSFTIVLKKKKTLHGSVKYEIDYFYVTLVCLTEIK